MRERIDIDVAESQGELFASSLVDCLENFTKATGANLLYDFEILKVLVFSDNRSGHFCIFKVLVNVQDAAVQS